MPEKIKKIPGPTGKDRADFLERVMDSRNLTRHGAIRLLAKEAGERDESTTRRFSAGTTQNHRDCPFSLWRLWHLVLFKEDVSK